MSSPASTEIARAASRLAVLTTVLVVGTAALLAWPLTVGLSLGRLGWREAAALLPPLLYLLGLVHLRGALVAVARGQLFGAAVGRALWRLGAAMLAGAALQVVVLPQLMFWLLGPGRGGALLYFDVAAFSVGAIGAGLLLIARLFERAAAMAAELDGFV